MTLKMDLNMPFGETITKLRLFDLTQFGQKHILEKKSIYVDDVICVFII